MKQDNKLNIKKMTKSGAKTQKKDEDLEKQG